ncbi:MAG: hypothetical protein R3211_11690, partial [Balneolaceae bacterium]|nr:hypothetical protein [Balneolaceae bacterium]
GNLTNPDQKTSDVAEIFKLLGKSGIPSYYIPGPQDTPLVAFLREAYNIELIFGSMHGVHGTFAFAPRHYLFAGMGGELVQDPKKEPPESGSIQYEAWQVEYLFKVLKEMKDYPMIFLFASQPKHRVASPEGSDELTQIINTHQPKLVIVRGEEYFERKLGSSLYICPGNASKGTAAIIDFQDRSSQQIVV